MSLDWISTRSRRQEGKVLHALHTPDILQNLRDTFNARAAQ
jgi:hypothetical protein